ncbi:MAG: hypothetical protein ACRD8Z_19330 [Nitrososphaeraceae archaeon]
MVIDTVSKTSQNWSRYMTTRGLTEHIGASVSQFPLYIAKEDTDNAADYAENAYMGADDLRTISILVQTNDSHLRITTRNSNVENRPTALQTNLEDIVNYDYFTSTKKNKFRIGRGAIGDATKPKLSMPYALLYEKGAIKRMMGAPLILRYNNQESKISLDTSKFIANKLEAIIETKEKRVPYRYSQVQLIIPSDQFGHDSLKELKDYYLNYSIFSTHIKFNFNFNGEKLSTPGDSMASATWTNQITAWAYTDNEFYVFLENLADQSKTVSNILEGWRELKWLPNEWKEKELNRLSKEEKMRLLHELKSHSKPMEKLPTPYGGNKVADELRKKALIKRIASIYDVDQSYVQYKVIRARYTSYSEAVNFPYAFEVVAIPFGNIWKSYPAFIGSVNNSVSIINSGKSLYDGLYKFKDKDKIHTVWNIDGILDRWYGYSIRESSKSWPCVVACNLLTPKIQWKEQGKSTLVIEPFSDTIINTITSVMKKMPTFHGMGLGRSAKSKNGDESKSKPKKLDKIGCLRKFLEDRYTQFETVPNTIDPEIMLKDRTSQSDVYYALRQTLFPENDIVEAPGTRKYITARINAECKSLFKRHGQASKRREDLGITAGHRAELYFMGNNQNISLDSIKSLAKYGTDALFIEKEDGIILLEEQASLYGLALINTHGHMTEYGKDFVKAFTEEKVCAVSFTDLDAAGVAIAAGAGKRIPRIGVTDEMLEYFGIARKDVDEKYTPKKNQITKVKKLVQKYELGRKHGFKGIRKYEDEDTGEWIEESYANYRDYRYVHDELDYILGPDHDGSHARRIEINSVKARLKTNLGLEKYKEKFWSYIEKKLLEFAPTRNYNRVISSKPNLEHYYPDPIQSFDQYIRRHVMTITNKESAKITKELTIVNGFLNVMEKQREIENRLGKIVSEDEHLRDLATGLEELIKKKSLDN